MKTLLITSTFLSLTLFQLSYAEVAVLDCKGPPFKEEAYSILKALGYSASCSTSALELCESQCKYDFEEAISKMREAIVGAEVSLQSARKEFDTISSCLVSRPPESEIETDPTIFGNCEEIKQSGDTTSGTKTIYPFECCPGNQTKVYCQQSADDGGWTVIQRRVVLAIREDFYRNWTDYKMGFGNLTGEFWLGLDVIHALTARNSSELRIDMEDEEGNKRFAKYKSFYVEDEAHLYKLEITGYSGDAGDSMAYHNGKRFSTHDNGHGCPKINNGAWWYGNCYQSNLNGYHHVGNTTTFQGITWNTWLGSYYSLSKVTMMIRPHIDPLRAI